MTVTLFAFYLFAIITIASAFFVVIARNPVHSVLWLILAFFSTAGLFVLAGAEFIAMLLVIVYVGAVAVLFLFVVMMLDVDFAELKTGIGQHLPIALLIGTILLVEFGIVFGRFVSDAPQTPLIAHPAPTEIQNTPAIGQIVYTDYFLLFQLAGLVLLVAMIGAIVLTLYHRANVKRQDVLKQIYRDPKDAMQIKDVKPGQGI